MGYSAHRDFRESTKNQIKQICDEVAPKDNWFSVTADDLGDLFTQQSLIQGTTTAVEDGLHVEDQYHRDVIDANNASRDKIDQIWKDVNHTANTYLSKFVATEDDLEGFQQQLDSLADIMGSGVQTGSLNDATIKGTDGEIDKYLATSKLLGEIESDKGFDGKVDDPEQLYDLYQTLGRTAFNLCPNLEIGDSWSLVIGPGLTITFSYDLKGDGGAPATLKMEREKDIKDKIKATLSSSEEGPDINKYGIPNDTNGWVSDLSNEEIMKGVHENEITVTFHRTYEGATETYTYTLDKKNKTFTASLTVSQAFGATVATGKLDLSVDQSAKWNPYEPQLIEDTPFSLADRDGLWNIGTIPATQLTPNSGVIVLDIVAAVGIAIVLIPVGA